MSGIDGRIAIEVMGWEKCEGLWESFDRSPIYCRPDQWKPSINIAHAFEMETRIEELGLKEKYCEALLEILENDEDAICPADMFEFIHADPSDRSKAALKAVKETS